MKNFKEIKQALIDQDTILVAVTEKIKEMKKDEGTQQFMIKQFQDVHRDQIFKIIKEAKVIVSNHRKEIENLQNLLDAWSDVKTLLGHGSLTSDAHMQKDYLEKEIQELVKIIDWNTEWD